MQSPFDEAPTGGPLSALRRRLIMRAGAPLELRDAGPAGVGLYCCRAVKEGEVLLRERPWAAVPLVCSGVADGAGLQLCSHCLGPAGTPTEQLQAVAAAAGVDAEAVAALQLPGPGLAAAAAARWCTAAGCGAVWCSASCEQKAAGWHGLLCSAAGRAFGKEVASSANPGFALAARLLAQVEAGLGDADTVVAADGMGGVGGGGHGGQPVGIPELAGVIGAAWWDTLAPAGGHDEDGGGWGSGYGAAFREAMVAQTAKLAELLAAALPPLRDGPPPPLDMDGGGGWLSTAGLGWLAGVARLNAQAVRVPSPLPAAVHELAGCGEAELDLGLASLQPVIAARSLLLDEEEPELEGARAEPEPEEQQQQTAASVQDADDDEEDEKSEDEEETDDEDDEEGGLLDLADVFPPAGGLGLFLLESAANHSCRPAALVAPIMLPPPDGQPSAAPVPGIALVAARDLVAGEVRVGSCQGDRTFRAAAIPDRVTC